MPTGISEALPMTGGKGMAHDVFNLQGQRVASPVKGMYIMRTAEGRSQGKNGKKVVIK